MVWGTCFRDRVCDLSGDWDMQRPGVTAIAHPASLEIATTHGVFILDKVDEIITKYKQGIRGWGEID